LQGNQVRKKERKKNNRTAEALPRKKELEIDPSTNQGDQQFFFDPPPAYIWFVGTKRCSHRFKVSNQISTLPPSLNVGYLDM